MTKPGHPKSYNSGQCSFLGEESQELKYQYGRLSSGTRAKSTSQASDLWQQCAKPGHHNRRKSHLPNLSWASDIEFKEKPTTLHPYMGIRTEIRDPKVDSVDQK